MALLILKKARRKKPAVPATAAPPGTRPKVPQSDWLIALIFEWLYT
jgi:hypothetical protein